MQKKFVFIKIEFSIPLRTLCGLCVLAKPLGVLYRHPCRNPKPLPRGEGLCILGWLCVLQSLVAYTPGIRAGAILLGLPPLVQARMLAVSHIKPLHDAVAQMADDLYGGYAQSKDALVACQKFCTMQNQQSKQYSTPQFLIIKRFFNSLKLKIKYFLPINKQSICARKASALSGRKRGSKWRLNICAVR